MTASPDEFTLIRRYFDWPASHQQPGVVLGPGDDAALLQPTPGHQLVVSTDTLVAGRHFPVDAAAADIAHKALQVNLSDLAAMGARPWAFTLALTLPAADADWLAAFAVSLQAQAASAGVALVGGDTTRGPLAIGVTVLGEVVNGQALRRDGARAGDLVVVSGSLGDAGLGLACVLPAALPLAASLLPGLDAPATTLVRQRLQRPTARLALGQRLIGLATAAMDVSDGLWQDLAHLRAASGDLGVRLDVGRLPCSLAGEQALRQDAVAWRQLQLSAGDDYELLFTVPASARERLLEISLALDLPLTVIGELTADPTAELVERDQAWLHPLPSGYQHF